MNIKNLTKILLGVSMAASMLFVTCFAEEKLTYRQGQFTDVSESAWYAKEVGSAYELGLMNGTSDTLFSPDGNVTVAQGITMASRIHAIQNGKTIPDAKQGAKWYENYVSYAVQNGIVEQNAFDNYDRPLKRSEMACLIYDGADRGSLEAQNKVLYVPDVPSNADYRDKLLVLYNAGIVMGSDAKGSFHPDDNLRRSECAAIINRVMLPQNRLKKDLAVESPRDAYILSEEPTVNGMRDGVASGWVYDNRGGVPRESVKVGNYLMISDISTEYGTAMIREFNQITVGNVVTEAKYTVKGYGAYLEFQDIYGKPTYQIKLVDGSWSILGADGKYTPVFKNAAEKDKDTVFTFKITIDLDKKQSTTIINDVNYGTHPLLSDNLLNYRYATDEKSTATVTTDYFCMTANYKAFEYFSHTGVQEVYGWKTTENVSVADGELVIKDKASATKSFDKASGDVTAQTYFILPGGGSFDFALCDASKDAFKVYAKDNKLYAGDKELYTLTKNMWYRLRVDYNTNTGAAKVWLNGRVVGEINAETCTGVDSVKFSTTQNNAKFDYIKVYEVITHDDYVPEPSSKASLDDYIVGLNVCSLWKNGMHRGWACISPFDEPRPVLGYYDEGVPETADWEIKFMAEHGIDFQSFCWYNNAATGTPVKDPSYADALHEGYMYAKYSDYMKYNLIWEASNCTKFGSKMFREQIVPYWFENYFLDERYIKIDNKILLCIFGADELYSAKYFGSVEGAKAEFDYLDKVAKDYGFDGFVVITNSGSMDKMAQMGIEGKYVYSWSHAGKTVEANKNGMLSTVNDKKLKTVPTVSVGFDSMPWHGLRYGNMTVSDYKITNDWVVNEFLPKYATGGGWNDKFIMLSTWNEYGEGTYISPSGLNGFGYLDVLRDVYTELPDEHTDHVPTFEQARRINHLYPQYRNILRHDGWLEKQEISDDSYETVYIHEYNKENTKHVHLDASKVVYDQNGITGVSTPDSDDPIVHMAKQQSINVDKVTTMNVTLKAPKGTPVDIFFLTKDSKNWAADKRMSFTTDSDELKTYAVKITNPLFKGTLLEVRIDPVNKAGVPFTLKSFELLKLKEEEETNVYVNGIEYKSEVAADVMGSKVLYPFDPATGEVYGLNLHHTWDKSMGVLTIEGNHKTLVFTVGDDEYVADGTKKPLGYTLYKKNGLPMLDFKLLSDELGYESEIKGKCIYIKTPQYEIYERKANRVPGIWEFNDYDSEGWASTHMSLTTSDGALKMTTLRDDHFDPVMRYEGDIKLDAAAYMEFKVRVRYNYTNKYNDTISVFYLTDKDTVWNEAKSLKLPLPSMDSKGEWVELTYNLRNNPEWKNNITHLRFDPFNCPGTMEVDYMRFIKDPDYVYVDPATIPFKIVNGDAEDTDNAKAFYSNNTKISIIEDPRDSKNHVYLIKSNEGKQWAYFRQAGIFKPGKHYKISYDLCMVDTFDGKIPSGTVNISTNLRYPDAAAQNGIEHVIGHTAAKAGEWNHVEVEFTTQNVDNLDNHEFTIYANPYGNVGVNYMVDNIVVIESDIAID